DGLRPTSIKVNLLANGTVINSQTVTAGDDWSYSFTDLPKYANGSEIVYTVTEDAVADYTTTYDGYNITNSYTPGKTSITVTKV
ncbi:Cna B-type domain-containing protein, partial [Streptococcus agalactiae]|nr:Cna B-type domain-containing protein [Streptococcus agalactiae]